MEAWQLITIALAAMSLLIILIAYRCFNDEDPDMYWNDNYQVAERPHVALNTPCKHTGEKSLICEWTICGCEKVNTYCDDCGKMIAQGDVEC